MTCLHAWPSFLVHLCVLLCMSLRKGTRFGAMVIHSGTLFGGLHYSAVSETFMSTSMEREYQVQSPSPPPSPSQPGRSLLASPKAKRRYPPPSRRSNTPFTSVSQPRAASRLVQSPSASTADSPSLPAQRPSPSRSASGLGRSRSRGRLPSRSTSKPRPKRGKNIANGGRNPQFPPVMCALRAVHKRPPRTEASE